MRLLALSLGMLAAATAAAQPSSAPRTYCNPLDIDYRYNYEQLNEGISYRAGADPVIVRHKGAYYLFETIGNGWWRSDDLARWTHVDPDKWPFEEVVAPAALSVRDTLYLFQSTFEQRPILTVEPETGHVEFYNRWLPRMPGAKPGAKPGEEGTGPWDPDIFHDDRTDRWYMYFGSSNVYPIYGVELDKRRRLAYAGTPTPLLKLHPDVHGWERFGRDHRDTNIAPFIEGAWMTQHDGRYYLQYGAPGTEYNVYSTGTYVGDAPLGPFTYAPYNPVSYRPGGFMSGAGHGNTFEDRDGNWWTTGTAWLGLNWNFERRIVLFPAGFERDGQLYADTRFGDFPHYLPAGKWSSSDALFTGWMLLSYHKPATASSARDSFPASRVTDENPRTFWLARTAAPDEWLAVDLGAPYDVRAVQVNYADYHSGLFATDSTVYTQFRLSGSLDGAHWSPLADLSSGTRRDRPNAYVELPAPVRARYVRYEHVHIGAPNLAISDLRVFGTGSGRAPATPAHLSARRAADQRNATIRWTAVRGAVGYNVLWGIAPDRLHETYQRFADDGTMLELRALTVGQSYWVAIESFDENGVSKRSAVVKIEE